MTSNEQPYTVTGTEDFGWQVVRVSDGETIVGPFGNLSEIEALCDRYNRQGEPTPLHKILDGDQHEARVKEWEGASQMIARSVSAYYRELVDGGVPEKRAYRLTMDFQQQIMFEKVDSKFVGSLDFGDD